MKSSVTYEQLAQLCQQGQRPRDAHGILPSGFAELDAQLPGGGWTCGAVAELMSDAVGIGELGLLMPALSALARRGRHIAWIAPPFMPYAPALVQRGLPLDRLLLIRTSTLQQSLWATEQTLRCPSVGAVLSWPAHIIDRNVRRLQLAAEAGGSVGFLFRPPGAALEPSPAALRLRLHVPAADGNEETHDSLVVEIQKSRGGRAGMRLRCRNSRALAVHSSAAASA